LEIHYKSEKNLELKAGQCITFILPKIWWRAYSILEQKENKTVLIIKRVKKENWWRWWSIFLCDAKIWDKFNWVWPAGHFTLKEKDNNKLFIWTWTGFVPLYNQIIAWLERWDKSEYTFLFWIRKQEDIFYKENLEELSQKYKNFKFQIYLSREESENSKKWYVTEYLTKNNLSNINESYICWAPSMVESAISKLTENWINKENIYFEKY
jgi:NAD(P)H-flavin reductase